MTEDAAIPSPPPSCHPERSEGSGPSSGRETRFLVAPLLGMTEDAAPRNDRRRRHPEPSAVLSSRAKRGIWSLFRERDQIPRRSAPRNDRRTPLLGMTEDAAIPSPPPSCHPERSEGSGPSSGRETRFLVAPLLGMTEEAAPRNDRRGRSSE